MTQEEISYALAKQIPDMAWGFSINTSYGVIQIPAGLMCDRICMTVKKEFTKIEGVDKALKEKI